MYKLFLNCMTKYWQYIKKIWNYCKRKKNYIEIILKIIIRDIKKYKINSW